MPPQLPAVKVAPERLEQLKAIGSKLDLSLSDTIAYLIRAEVARGTIPDTVPFVSITRSGDKVKLSIYSQSLTLPVAAARNLAETIETAASGAIAGVLNLDERWKVARVGNGVRIQERPFTRDVARDIARLLRIACA